MHLQGPTCTPAGELGFLITAPESSIAALLIAAILTVLLSIAAPQLRNAAPLGAALEFPPTAPSRRGSFLEK